LDRQTHEQIGDSANIGLGWNIDWPGGNIRAYKAARGADERILRSAAGSQVSKMDYLMIGVVRVPHSSLPLHEESMVATLHGAFDGFEQTRAQVHLDPIDRLRDSPVQDIYCDRLKGRVLIRLKLLSEKGEPIKNNRMYLHWNTAESLAILRSKRVVTSGFLSFTGPSNEEGLTNAISVEPGSYLPGAWAISHNKPLEVFDAIRSPVTVQEFEITIKDRATVEIEAIGKGGKRLLGITMLSIGGESLDGVKWNRRQYGESFDGIVTVENMRPGKIAVRIDAGGKSYEAESLCSAGRTTRITVPVQ
jgi:hypothetical protein